MAESVLGDAGQKASAKNTNNGAETRSGILYI
jgi:hypothetical protein